MPKPRTSRPTAVRRAAKLAADADGHLPQPNTQRALQLVMRMMAIPGRSGEESKVVDFVTEKLRRAGAPAGAVVTDGAWKRTPLGGNVGNLIFKLPGTCRGPRRVLMAHLDTVPICVGSKPVLKGRYVHSADPQSGLGADDRAGAAVVLNTALEILRRKLPHPPLTFFWSVQEEVGLYGARNVPLRALGAPRLAFNWDGGNACKLTVGATGGYRIEIEVEGRASHAGGAPERGISAIAIASLAIAELVQNGWHGDIRKNGSLGTSNVGVIHGGAATNVVPNLVELRAEARSHQPKFRRRIVREIESAFRRAARSVRSADGATGRVRFEGRLDYEAFKLDLDEPCVLAAAQAVRAIGAEPEFAIANGGLDANWMTRRGIPTVSMGCGQMNPHTVDEQLDVATFHEACRIALRLATDTA